ncbi:hypothetical protein QCA50_004349 [Cerrena zonata]|uniref:SET domain-containing protein n=1 Tax=Cerrena zonata TaxID=2478898 RepID=A0AAW0GT94_9APHY
MKQTKLSTKAPTTVLSVSTDDEELPDRLNLFKLAAQRERRATTGSIAHEVINLISDEEEDDDPPNPIPEVPAPARPELSQRRHTMDTNVLGKSKEDAILISDDDEDGMTTEPTPPVPEPQRSPSPTTEMSPPRRLVKRLARKSASSGRRSTFSGPIKEKSPRKSASQLQQRLAEILLSTDEEDEPRQSGSSKPASVASISTDPIVPALGDMSLGKSSPESELAPSSSSIQVATKRTGPLKPRVKVKGVLYGDGFFRRTRPEDMPAATTATAPPPRDIPVWKRDPRPIESISAPVPRLPTKTFVAASLESDNDSEDELLIADKMLPTSGSDSESREETPAQEPPIHLSPPKSTSHRMHPSSPRPKKMNLTDVINAAYARNAQSHVDLTQDKDELLFTSPTPPLAIMSILNNNEGDTSESASVPMPQSLEIDTQEEGVLGTIHDPAHLMEEDPEFEFPADDPDQTAQASSASATSATGEQSDVEMDEDESKRKTRRSTRVKKQVVRGVRGTQDMANLRMWDPRSRSPSVDSFNAIGRRTRGRPRKRGLSPSSSNTSSEGYAPSSLLDICGIEFFSWRRDGERVAKEFCQTTMLAKDLPHELVDYVNSLQPSMRTAETKRKIFKAIISKNTEQEEPNAPPIDIVNTVDNEPTPAYEFHYTNLMWHSENVGKPDFDALQGCGCRGVCNPKRCACAKRQREQLDYDPELKDYGFVYDKNKRLRVHQYPIFECNAFCGCDDDCQNRVVQNGRKVAIELRKTEFKGWGVFAGQSIPANTFVGIYSGEFITDTEAQERGGLYNNFGRTYLFDLDFWYLAKRNKGRPKYCIDAYHAGNFTRYLNHSCDPNCVINPCYINEPDLEKPLLTIFTQRDVAAGEELCFLLLWRDD